MGFLLPAEINQLQHTGQIAYEKECDDRWYHSDYTTSSQRQLIRRGKRKNTCTDNEEAEKMLKLNRDLYY